MSLCPSKSNHSISLIISFLLLVSAGFSVRADEAYIGYLQKQAIEKNLSANIGWHTLLHYKKGMFGYSSQADDRRFFNAENGHQEPQDELVATIRVLLSESDDEMHAQCRFPARFHWLDQQLGFDRSKITLYPCAELEKWRKTLKPYSLDLIFPAAFLNGPSSMFGHTLIRINSYDHRKNLPLVGYALNYAANSDVTDNALFFSLKGLIGGYPGIFSIVPYYEKLNEYRDIENRDIWEYSLNFTQEEVEQLLRHTWELRHISFDYYYLTENCSYHMLSLMEVARPGLKLTDNFDTKAIPADTVRAIIDAGLVDDIKYRPSTTTTIKQHAKMMDEVSNRLSIDLVKHGVAVDGQRVKALSPVKQAQVLEQGYDYSRYLFTETPNERDARARQNWSLLAARSESDVKNIWDDIVAPSVSPDKAHDTARFALGLGEMADKSFLSLKIRPSFHDLLDPPEGYPSTSQINFVDLNLRYFDDSEKLRLDKLTVINVLSLAPRDIYFDPISWGVDVAVERVESLAGRINVAQLTVDGGLSYLVGDAWVFSGLFEFNLKASKRLDEDFSAGAGLRLNLLNQGARQSTQLILKSMAFRAGEENDNRLASIEHAFNFSINTAMRLLAVRTKSYDRYTTLIELSAHWFY